MTAMTETRTWTLTVHGPAPMYSVNTREHWRKTSAARKQWREATYLLAKQTKLPKLLGRVRIDITLHFTDIRPRDTANFHPTVGKPCTDALAAGRVVRQKNGVMRTEVGYELIADDTPRHLDGPHLLIGGPVSKKDHPFGLVVITVTDLSGETTDV